MYSPATSPDPAGMILAHPEQTDPRSVCRDTRDIWKSRDRRRRGTDVTEPDSRSLECGRNDVV